VNCLVSVVLLNNQSLCTDTVGRDRGPQFADYGKCWEGGRRIKWRESGQLSFSSDSCRCECIVRVVTREWSSCVINRMLTRTTVALASLLVIAQLMQNGKQETGFGKVMVTMCMELWLRNVSSIVIFTWRSVTWLRLCENGLICWRTTHSSGRLTKCVGTAVMLSVRIQEILRLPAAKQSTYNILYIHA
jgi:hypothetical protein